MVDKTDNIKIDLEFKSLIPPLGTEERQQLKENLLTYGCRDALVLWKKQRILIDGHNRFEICTQHGIPFNVVELEFEDRDTVIAWIIDNQLGRRNLTPEALSYLRGKRYSIQKRQGQRSDLNQSDEKLTSRQSGEKLSDMMGKDYKVGSRTIERDAKYAHAIDHLAQTLGNDVRKELLGRDTRISKKATIELAQLAENDPNQAYMALDSLKEGLKPLSVAPHLKFHPGALVEINTPNNKKIHERFGRIASVHEQRVDVWVRNTQTMTMHKYQLKFHQIQIVSFNKQPVLKDVCERIAKLRGRNIDPFEHCLLDLLEQTVVLTPIESEYLEQLEAKYRVMLYP
ncbi:hypothetical protein C7H19_20060 [Aphanothece hegewaldii CCALA 016]|uniref:ParB/Sulfiredoxin domain-containing protein n=1 Tax=Aphanothece hegewaldii CCALA 016 TaxID=2107694 RepID=A0A2T1LT54_9CHRO|nr:hypothetical protein [Aphanothece hegewaldii]PSF33466.1 hypothetical protein C7H19_20060 [Aphanothece hegewaldii CCALA 016]